MFVAAGVMFVGIMATGFAHGPMAIVVLFMVLMVLCALVAFIFTAIGASKGRAENQRIVAEAEARARRR